VQTNVPGFVIVVTFHLAMWMFWGATPEIFVCIIQCSEFQCIARKRTVLLELGFWGDLLVDKALVCHCPYVDAPVSSYMNCDAVICNP